MLKGFSEYMQSSALIHEQFIIARFSVFFLPAYTGGEKNNKKGLE